MLRPNLASLANGLHGPVLKSFKRGTHRTTAPEATLARVAPKARQIGITRLGNVTGLDRIGIPVTVAVRPNSRSVSVSQGKGLGPGQALASAMMEAIELFHGEDLMERTVLASFHRLSAETRVVSPASLSGTGIPLPDRTEIPWIEGYDLLGREPCWVPWEALAGFLGGVVVVLGMRSPFHSCRPGEPMPVPASHCVDVKDRAGSGTGTDHA